ncbi:Uncharacterised protein [Turicibacter sanguinis]|nr:Uncharacterised protein [Turicibacter sanguinis]
MILSLLIKRTKVSDEELQGHKLRFSPLPMYMHGKNIRTVSAYHWKSIRQIILEERGCICEICGVKANDEADRKNFHVHEKWDVDIENHVLHLKDLELSCRKCHDVEHIGRVEKLIKDGIIPLSTFNELLEHYANINGCDIGVANYAYQKCKEDYKNNKLNYDRELANADWKFTLYDGMPLKDKMTKSLINKGLLYSSDE